MHIYASCTAQAFSCTLAVNFFSTVNKYEKYTIAQGKKEQSGTRERERVRVINKPLNDFTKYNREWTLQAM